MGTAFPTRKLFVAFGSQSGRFGFAPTWQRAPARGTLSGHCKELRHVCNGAYHN